MNRLESVATALEEGRASDALDELLVAWREKRATEIADAVDAIAKAFPHGVLEGDDPHSAWLTLAREGGADRVGTLLENLVSAGTASTLVARVEKLAEREPDPRVAIALAKLTLDPPTTSSANFPVWPKIFGALEDIRDARVVPILKERLAMAPGASQFWPKFYKGIERVLKKPPPAPALDKDEKKLLTAIVRGARKVKPAPPSPAATRAPTKVARSGDPLARAVASAEAGDLVLCLEALLEAWRGKRLDALGAAIDRVGGLLDEGRAPPGGKDAALHKAWLALAAAGRASDVGLLAESAGDGKPSDAEVRLDQMLLWPPDPRVGKAMLIAAISGSFSARPRAWKAVGELLVRNADPRFREAVERFTDIRTDNEARRSALRRSVPGVMATIADVPPATGDEARSLAKLDAALDAHTAAHPTSERRFLEAIAAAPADDAPRLVYADWLTERGHPRGELIVLQCSAKRDEKRIATVTAEHSRALAGPFAALAWKDLSYSIRSGMITLDRGLPVGLELRAAPPPWCYERHPLLLTLEALKVGLAEVDTYCTLVRSSRAIRRILQAHIELVTALCRFSEPLPIEEVHLVHSDARGTLETMLAGVEGNGLSRTKRLEVGWNTASQAWEGGFPEPLVASPMMSQVEELAVSTTALDPVLRLLRQHKRKVRQLTFMRRHYVFYRIDVTLDATLVPTAVAVRSMLREPLTLEPGENAAPLLAVLRGLGARLPTELDPGITLSPALRAEMGAIV